MTSFRTLEAPAQTEQPPRVLVNSVPKAGTHLLEKVLRLLPEFTSSGLHIDQFVARSALGNPDIEHGDALVEAPIGYFESAIAQLSRGQYATSHFLYADTLAHTLAKQNVYIVGIIRDPRDIVISFTKYVATQEFHYLFNEYQSLSPHDQIMTSIIGIPERVSQYITYLPKLMDIDTNIRAFLPWSQYPHAYVTSFEKLIGPQGGGTLSEQYQELTNITKHLGVNCTNEQIRALATNVFGSTATFRKGIIGDWRNHFTEAHKRAFKNIAGQLLIDLGYEKNLDW